MNAETIFLGEISRLKRQVFSRLVCRLLLWACAFFLGGYTPEAAGDYLAGPNHVLPTMGTARFASALGVETFLKKSSIISYSKSGLQGDAEHIKTLARLEGLTAHAASVSARFPED
mgnify:CR=1 FL=1